MREAKETFDICRTADAFSPDDWDRIAREVIKFKTSLLYGAFMVRQQERVHYARTDMEKAKETNDIFHHQGRVLAHKRDIMIFEDILEIARNPSPKRTSRHARA